MTIVVASQVAPEQSGHHSRPPANKRHAQRPVVNLSPKNGSCVESGAGTPLLLKNGDCEQLNGGTVRQTELYVSRMPIISTTSAVIATDTVTELCMRRMLAMSATTSEVEIRKYVTELCMHVACQQCQQELRYEHCNSIPSSTRSGGCA